MYKVPFEPIFAAGASVPYKTIASAPARLLIPSVIKYIVPLFFSAGDKADSDFPNDGGAKSLARIRLYGDGDLHQNEYGLTYLANQLLRKTVDKPVIYHACGGQDPWRDMNHIVRDYFLSHPEYDYTYDEIPEYGHEWPFWDIELRKFLDFAGLVKR